MTKICFLYTDTNGLHKCYDNVSTKNLYKFARLIAFHYLIGTYENGIFTETLKKTIILEPKTINFDKTAMSFHKITMNDAMTNGINNIQAITQFKKDIEDINIIVSHSLAFHLKALQVECYRTAIDINFNKYILVDMLSFGHNLDYPKLIDLIKKYNIKEVTQLEQYRELFFILYKDHNSKNSSKDSLEDECDFVD